MTTIVVPLDGSAFSERALRPACSIAARLEHSRVLLVSCTPDDVDLAQHDLDDRAHLYSEVVHVETRLVDDGDPARAILAAAASESDAIVCMATHGRGGIGATVLGSVAKQVVCRSTQPLVLVGPHCRTALLPDERGRLLVCSDGSTLSDSIIPIAAEWCERLHLEPWLAEAVPPDENPEAAHRPARNRQVEAATARLAKLSARLGASGAPARSEVLHGTPSRAIARFAERLPAALIAIATHGRSGLTRITMGSVATDVVRHAPCPVLITRPTDNQACIDE
jgi:nucleotide-binding universal stress UspA family protein